MDSRDLVRWNPSSRPEDIAKYQFPYDPPYLVQTELMDAIYNTIKQGGIGILESPTGTGKSLSIICASMRWLNEVKLNGLESVSTSKPIARSVDSGEPDWMKEHDVNANAYIKWKEQRDGLKNAATSRLAAYVNELDHWKLRKAFAVEAKAAASMLDKQSSLKSDDDESELILSDWDEDMESNVKKRQYCSSSSSSSSSSADEKRTTKLKARPRKEKASFGDNPRPNIIFATRTHSQITQFIDEIRKTEYGRDADSLFVPVASRKQLCVNPQVQKLKSTSAMNDKCQELLEQRAKSKTKKRIRLESGTIASKERTKTCPMYSKARIQHLADIVVDARILDIEELAEQGKQHQACPYFASRHVVALQPDFILAPYASVLGADTREGHNIPFHQHSVVIFDEAHNVIDAITEIQSARVSLLDLDLVSKATKQYLERYEKRLSPQNLFQVKKYITILDRLASMITKHGNHNSGESHDAETKKKVFTTVEFLCQAQLEHLNMFQLESFITHSKLTLKLYGFAQKYTTSDDDALDKSDTKRSSFHAVVSLLHALTHPVDDGRLVLSGNELKFIMLNPAKEFESILSTAHAILFLGGTLSPKQYLLSRLMLNKQATASKPIVELSCGHVIPDNHLLPLIVPVGPSNQPLSFSFQHRSQTSVMDELGRLVLNVCRLVPGGLIIFSPSYAYESQVFGRWKDNGLLDQMVKLKPVFREDKGTAQTDLSGDSFAQFRNAIVASRQSSLPNAGAILSAVMGGKLSEGINFQDDLGRAVIVVGMPFPNPNDPEYQQLVAYLSTTFGSDVANQYAEDVCMKTVNQTIGRVIRHAKDYASILLVDHRYQRNSVRTKLPLWIQRNLQPLTQFGEVIKRMAQFYKQMRNAPAPA